ncbi:MAG: hypothetical protein ABI910_05430 [Gemmatimonadota bacterium]
MSLPEDVPVAIDNFLTVRLAGNSGDGERFLLIGRPYDGLVHVREWTPRTFNTAGEDFDVDALELMTEIEATYAAGRPVAPEMYEIRLWLGA